VKITAASARLERFDLTRPYAIVGGSFEDVANVILELRSGERLGLGAASPEAAVTGETLDACREALSAERLQWLIGRDVQDLPALVREAIRDMPHAPAARAALDMALHDLLAQHLGVPLVEMLGRVHERLPTSITIGIKGVEATLDEAREYAARGFRVLKVKLGNDLQEDIERLQRLRGELGDRHTIRVDANQGYSRQQLLDFCEHTDALDIELIEQPLPAGRPDPMRGLPESIRARLAADESLHDEADALRLSQPPAACGIFNIKLMKCGGIWSGLRIGSVAELAGIELMWGCMDESVISISAALHAALASPATRYLDLDGSLDLARDVARGGFVLSEGCLSTTERPGLGVELL
jgi:L-alanine-DL-glutamate epimerase-like enolase superfamily enzyme